ncbi:hypothetical protein [Robertmurraya kyonggiensis]|uniref:Uncharacterized protein n=1 Tax=Robertmurraya kyonggiensis TaxID=1037680 RepID=A0A4U1DA10_9BACI|nr:hypothetical protein [Robertmurraya kyonggiensis]TKC18958.1 hypothetical protein FA727_05265 [Robertmurraya kyonggiensis]
MDKEQLFQRVESMIISSTKTPKYVSFSTIKMADLFGVDYTEIERGISELLEEGRLQKSHIPELPAYEVYMLPSQTKEA